MIAPYEPPRHALAKTTRRLTQWRAARPVRIAPPAPLLSISFDDFPRSAATFGARVLSRHGVRATYYASLGLEGEESPSGPLFTREDLVALAAAGHEIGCHSHAHCDGARTRAALRDLDANRSALAALDLGALTHAYPYGETTMAMKRAVAQRYRAARGIAPGINLGRADAAHLKAFALYGDAAPDPLIRALDEAAARNGWVIAFTHDVCARPSAFGATPHALDALIRAAKRRNVLIMPVAQAAAIAFQEAAPWR